MRERSKRRHETGVEGGESATPPKSDVVPREAVP
jgi:hypothetical protein